MSTSLSHLLEKADVRDAAQNLGWIVAERLVRLFFTVLVGFMVARYLGPEQFGLFNYALAIVGFGAAVTGMGVDAVVRRELVRLPSDTASIMAAAGWLRLGAAVACYGLLWCWLWWTRPDATSRALLGILGLLLFQPSFTVADLWLQANLRARGAAFAQLSALSLGTVTRLMLVATRASLVSFAVVAVIEGVLAAAFLTWWARREGMRMAFRLPVSLAKRLLDVSWPLLFASLATSLYMRIDVVMLRHLAGENAAGIYAAAVKISEVWYFLPMAVASSALPTLLRARESGAEEYLDRFARYFDGSAALAYGIAIPVMIAAPWLVSLAFGRSFMASGSVLAVHVWTLPFVFVGVARGQYLVNENLTRFALLATGMGAMVNVALNFLLIPHWGPIGAAAATVISYAMATWLMSFLHPKLIAIAKLQTRALVLPITGWRYLARRHG